MRWVAMLAVVLAGLGGTAWAQDATAAIRGVISEQIAALKADDFATAFGFASPAIRRQFGSPERFGAMVREGYPMVWRPADVRFAALGDRDGRKVQSVLVTDQAGGAARARIRDGAPRRRLADQRGPAAASRRHRGLTLEWLTGL